MVSSSFGFRRGFNFMLAQKADIRKIPWNVILMVARRLLDA